MKGLSLSRIVIIFISLLISEKGAAEHAMRDFYIHIKKESIEVGEYEKTSMKPVAFKVYPIDAINADEIKQYFFADQTENILYYVHCWLGNIDFYNKGAIKKLERLNNIDKMIVIIWESNGVSYRSNWYNAQQEGSKIASLFTNLLRVENKNNILLCHSMGHSVFLGLAKELSPPHKYFKLIFFAGADLPENVLNEELKEITALSEQVVVYTHQKDRLLLISGLLHRKKRLGILPPAKSALYSQMETLNIIDVTHWPGNHSLSPSNHVYFKDHDGVRADMNQWIESKCEVRNAK